MSTVEARDTTTLNFEHVESTNNRLNVNTTNLLREASVDGQFYSWTGHFDTTDGDHVLFIRNTDSGKDLHLVYASVSVKVASVATLNRVSGLGSGAPATEVNWNFGSPNNAEVIAIAGAVDVGGIIEMQCVRLPNGGLAEFSLFGALTLNNGGDGITIQLSKGGTDTCAVVIGYYL